MCLIIACEPTRKLPLPTFHAALLSAIPLNPDGIGVSWTENGCAIVEKSVVNYDTIVDKALELYATDIPFAVHLRYNTSGKNSNANTHPFEISDRIAMMHNKTLWIEPPNRTWSDSRTVAELLKRMVSADKGFFDSELFYSFMEHQAGDDNRFVFVDGEFEQLVYVNKHLGVEVDGVWFSNLYSWNCRTAGLGLKSKNGKSGKLNHGKEEDFNFDYDYRFAGWDSDDMPLAWEPSRMDHRVMESPVCKRKKLSRF
jgi:hypothetical protein